MSYLTAETTPVALEQRFITAATDPKGVHITLSDVPATLRKRKLVLLAAILIGILFGLYQGLAQPRMYVACGCIDIMATAVPGIIVVLILESLDHPSAHRARGRAGLRLVRPLQITGLRLLRSAGFPEPAATSHPCCCRIHHDDFVATPNSVAGKDAVESNVRITM